MTTRRLGVLFTPSLLETAWRAALMRRAADIGWRVIGATEAPDHEGAATDVLILARDPQALATVEPRDCVILHEPPDTSAIPPDDAVARSEAAGHFFVRTSRDLAGAAVMAANGAGVVDARSTTLSLRGLGEVSREGDGPASASRHPEAALSMFDVLPVPVGAGATWSPACFAYPHKGEFQGGSPSIDMTGRVRGVFFGPYFALPPGTWQVDTKVSVDPEGGHAHLLFEWGTEGSLVGAPAEINRPGIYEMSLVRTWTSCEPAQARLWISQPLFQGRLEFLGCRVTRVADDTPQTSTP